MSEATLAGVVAAARRQLAEAGIVDAAQDARTLVAGLLKLSSTAIIIEGARILTAEEQAAIAAALARRAAREPVHRILGRRAFSRLDLALSPETLEPRPDTEVTVAAVERWMSSPRAKAQMSACSSAMWARMRSSIWL